MDRGGRWEQNCLPEQLLFTLGLEVAGLGIQSLSLVLWNLEPGFPPCWQLGYVPPTQQVQPSEHCALCGAQPPDCPLPNSAQVGVWRGHEELPEKQPATLGKTLLPAS